MSDKDVFRKVAVEIMGKGRLELVDECFAPGYVEHGNTPPGVPANREGARTYFTSLHEAFPDLKAEVVHQYQDGDTHIGHIRCTGKMTGDFMGMPASNKKATWEEMHIGKIKNGQIIEHWGVEDQLGMLRQLGFVPPVE